jgi:hypothetical protein
VYPTSGAVVQVYPRDNPCTDKSESIFRSVLFPPAPIGQSQKTCLHAPVVPVGDFSSEHRTDAESVGYLVVIVAIQTIQVHTSLKSNRSERTYLAALFDCSLDEPLLRERIKCL